MKWVPGLSRG